MEENLILRNMKCGFHHIHTFFPPKYHCDHNTSLHPQTNNYHHIASLNITITSIYGKFPIIWHVWGMGSVGYMDLLVVWENSYRNPMHSQNSMFLFYFMHGSLHKWQSKLMCKIVQIYTVWWSYIQLTLFITAPVGGARICSSASGI